MLLLAPDIGELKLFATALKMNTAFLTVDKRAREWIDEGWSKKTLEDLKREAAESEGSYTYNELKNKYLDMKDDFDKSVRDLRGKLQRFEQDPYSRGASPILRYERFVDSMGVKGKLFLGLNSHQAKGYRIVELDFPRWLEELMQTDPDVFRSEKLTEGEVYALVPSRGIDQEKISVLRNDFWEEMEKSGVPAFDTFRGYKELKPEFSSRLEKTIDKRYPFDTNVLRIQALEETIKREHALAVIGPREIATGPPTSPFKGVVPVAAAAPLGRKLEEWYVLYVPMDGRYVFNYMYRSSWDTKAFNSFDAMRDFVSKGEGILYLHAYRGLEPSRWDYPTDITPLKLQSNARWESGEGEDRHSYHLEQPTWTGLMWIWRISGTYKYGQIYRNETLEASEAQLLDGKYGYGGKKPEPIKTIARAPTALMDVDVRTRSHLKLNVEEAQKYYKEFGDWFENVFEPAVPIEQINLPAPWAPPRLKDNLEKIASTGSMPPVFLSYNEKTRKYDVADGIHRTNAAKQLGYIAVPAVVEYRRTYPPKIKTVSTPLYTTADATPKITPEEAKEEDKLEKESEEEIEDTREMEKEMEAEETAPLTEEQPAPTPIVPLEKPAVVTKPTVSTPSTAPAAPAPRPTRILSSEDMRLLQDYWNTQFIRAIGKVPAGFSSVFRIEFQEVKTLPFAEAKNAILAAADREIERIEQEQRARVTIRQGERITPGQPSKAPAQKKPMTDREIEEENEEGFRMPVGGKVPPSFFPPNPLSVEQPFPRGPTSLEQLRLWQVFCYEMQTEGYDCNQYAREFTEYINKTQFYDWEDLKENFTFFVDTIMEGATLPPLVQWRKELTVPKGIGGELRELEPSPEPAKLTTAQIEMEERNAVKRQRILIAQKAAGLISYNSYYVGRKQKTMHDLYEEMTSRGVINASIPEEIFTPVAKEAIREIYHEPLYTQEWIPIDGEEELSEKLNIGRSAFGNVTERQVENFLAT